MKTAMQAAPSQLGLGCIDLEPLGRIPIAEAAGYS